MKIGSHHLDLQEESWSRRHQALRVHQAGMLQMEIAQHLGVSRSRIHQMINQARTEVGRRSPLEKELAKGAWGLVEPLMVTCNNKAAPKMLAAGRDVIVV